mgnify:CR=1 FL=1
MIQQVLIGHPNSAKAHYVQAEIAARQGQLPRAREALATAEKLAPGLPFAKAESVWCNSPNFLNKEVGPGFRTIGPELYV